MDFDPSNLARRLTLYDKVSAQSFKSIVGIVSKETGAASVEN